ncbi:MAG TPA: hypothetical protein VF523_19075 [Burkholderiales bacterium]
MEAPYMTGVQTADAPRSSGPGDLLLNGAWRAINRDDYAVVFATDLISDTTRDVRLGSGKTVIAPTVYAAIELPGRDSVFFPSVQHYAAVSHGGSGSNVSLTSIRPGLLTRWGDGAYSYLDARFIVDWERSTKVGLTV